MVYLHWVGLLGLASQCVLAADVEQSDKHISLQRSLESGKWALETRDLFQANSCESCKVSLGIFMANWTVQR